MLSFARTRRAGTLLFIAAIMLTSTAVAAVRVKTDAGSLEGSQAGDIYSFKGIPYAAPPVGPLRWRPPQPAARWTGVRNATSFGARCVQARVFDDMIFRDQASEDCLYLNVWTPKLSAKAKLPVMVWIHGGGFVGGSGSEPRQDGENLAKKGVVVLNLNYRLGVLGFLSHPELTKESEHNASGNYGLMDQAAALQWVRKNIAALGGDPGNVTIFGESAGSFSVSALMASPLAKGLFQRAIGESGSLFGAILPAKPRAETEKDGVKLAESLNAPDLEALRAKTADEVLQAAQKLGPFRYVANVDGYFLPESVAAIYGAGRQARVPLLAGWNADEGNGAASAKEKPTPENFAAMAHRRFGDQADAFLKLYPADTPEQSLRSAVDLAGDEFIAYSTWKWIEVHAATAKMPVYRYRFNQAPPAAKDAKDPYAGKWAYHSAEIEYVFNALKAKDLPWRDEDFKVADLMSSYWVNFAKTGDPNGPGLPKWPAYTGDASHPVLQIGVEAHATPANDAARYQFLESTLYRK